MCEMQDIFYCLETDLAAWSLHHFGALSHCALPSEYLENAHAVARESCRRDELRSHRFDLKTDTKQMPTVKNPLAISQLPSRSEDPEYCIVKAFVKTERVDVNTQRSTSGVTNIHS